MRCHGVPDIPPHLVQEGSCVPKPEYFVSHGGAKRVRDKICENARTGRVSGRKEQTGGVSEEADPKVTETPDPPSPLHPHSVIDEPADFIPASHPDEEEGKIHTRRDGQLQRTPESGVHLQQLRDVVPLVNLEFHHGDTVPADISKEPCCGIQGPGGGLDALAKYADP